MKLFASLIRSKKNSFRIESRIAEDTGQFSADSINKAVPNYSNRLSEYMKAGE